MPLHRENLSRPLTIPTSLAVLGPGLIGGSILRACRDFFPSCKLRVWGRSGRALEAIQAELGGDLFVSTDPAEVVGGAGGIVLCTPVEFMEELAARFAGAVAPSSWITDAGSVKGRLAGDLESILGHRYVGAHPMAGSEKTGFVHSSANLFEDAVCILTPTDQTAPDATLEVSAFWRALGCRIFQCDPFLHDQLVADISHLPHLAASVLVQSINSDALSVAGPGFRDCTRVAMGDAGMWAGILLGNREAVLRSLDAFEKDLQEVRKMLQAGDRTALDHLLASAAQKRSGVLN